MTWPNVFRYIIDYIIGDMTDDFRVLPVMGTLGEEYTTMAETGLPVREIDTFTCVRDSFSHLPEELIDLILSYLPIKNAVATSILSRNWRNKWLSIPDLVFDEEAIQFEHVEQEDKWVNIITNVLICHTGSIKKFVFSHGSFQPSAAMDYWMDTYLQKAPLTFLELSIRQGDPYKIPSSVFNCQNLINLILCNCDIELPSTFTGFKKLKYLRLEVMKSSSPDVVDKMVSNSQLLEMLVLRELVSITRLNICAPKLWYIWIRTALANISFGPNRLRVVVMLLTKRSLGEEVQPMLSNDITLYKFFKPLKTATNFWFPGYLLKYFANTPAVPVQLPIRCRHMRLLSMTVKMSNTKEILACLCILRSCPNLIELTLFFKGEGIWESHIVPPCYLPTVKRLHLHNVSDNAGEMGFVKFLLSSAPTLQVLLLVTGLMRSTELLNKVVQFDRASPQAKVVCYDIFQYHSSMKANWDGSITVKRR